ncbi:MAG: amidohydrolase family protein, partial [Desulfurococcales archaeon]|nr:amidohydrolase family protein [Desulfurococcales archaeon]
IEAFKARVTEERIYNAVGDMMDYVALSRLPMMNKLVYSPGEAVREHIEVLREHTRSTEEVLKAARELDQILPVASLNPDRGISWNVERLRRVIDEIVGVKIFPTLHFIRPNHRSLGRLYRLLEEEGRIVIVHTGCDPGVWELPAMCSDARPRLVAEAARRYRDLVFVIAHLGSYSALQPGIFFHEALEALGLDNVYSDTSAADPFFVKRAVEEVGGDKLLFGSDYPYITGTEPRDWVNAILELDIPGRVKTAILYNNASRLLERIGL